MKKHIFIIILASLLLICACQPTPESPIVVGKDQSVMIEKAQEDTVYATAQTERETVDWRERLGVPERYTASLTSIGGHLSVEADAAIVLPDVELPVVQIAPYLFTDEDAQRFVTALLGEDPQCVTSEDNWRTRAMWEKEITQLKEDLDHWDTFGGAIWGGFDTRAELEEYLQQKIAKAADAPERPETAPLTWEWKMPTVWNKDGYQTTTDRYIGFLTLNADNSESSLAIDRASEWGRSGIRYMREAGSDVHFTSLDGSWQNELSVSLEDAQRMAEEKLHEMGLDHLTCAFHKSVRSYRGDVIVEGNCYEPFWAFVFTQSVNGVPVGYTFQPTVEPSEYNRVWQYEQCRVLVDEKGVAFIEYESPCRTEEVKVEAATLLPFDKIKEIFEKMVLIVDNNADLNDFEAHYRISEVRLSMVSIPEQNGNGGLLVPCWDFMGESSWFSENSNVSKLGARSDGTYCYLTINAIDGSIITRQ